MGIFWGEGNSKSWNLNCRSCRNEIMKIASNLSTSTASNGLLGGKNIGLSGLCLEGHILKLQIILTCGCI